MTIDEYRAQKTILENSIMNMIKKFEKDSGVCVNTLSIDGGFYQIEGSRIDDCRNVTVGVYI